MFLSILNCFLRLAAAPFFETVDLFEVPMEGYQSYRIPAIVATPKGAVLAFTSARRAVSDWAAIDIVMRRSLDGKTWQPRRVIAGDGTSTTDNPTPIVDRGGVIHFLYQVNYVRLFYMRSGDDGVTFTRPVDITAAIDQYRPEYDWNVAAPGPGHAIQLRNGRLLVPIWLSKGGRKHRPSVISTIYSDDEGKTWKRGGIVPAALPNMSEHVAVELADGRVMLNIRSEHPGHRRAVAYSPDGIHEWTKPELHPDLYDPICMASLLRLTARPAQARNRLLFANPDSRANTRQLRAWGGRPRENVTLRLSYDEGRTWPVSRILEPGRGGYTDLTIGPDGTMHCLYERGAIPGNELNTRYLTVARFNLEWLTGGKDSLQRIDNDLKSSDYR